MDQYESVGRKGPRPKANYIHHRFASLPFVKAAIASQEKSSLYQRGQLRLGLAVLAVLTHHGQFSWFLEEQGRRWNWEEQRGLMDKQIDFIEPVLPALWDWMNERLKQWGYREAPWNPARLQKQTFLEEFDRWHSYLLGSASYPGWRISDRFEHSDRLVFWLIKGLLMASDWQASGHCRPAYEVLNKLDGYLYLGTARRAYEAGRLKHPRELKWEQFQEAMASYTDNAICVVACGKGKTEAAGLWVAADSQRRPVIYLLPTQVTSTKLADRLSDYLPKATQL
jgi:hypothetical protein